MKKINILTIPFVLTCLLFPSCNNSAYKKFDFKYWNDCQTLNNLKEDVYNAVTPNAKKDSKGRSYFVEKEDRIAVFDMDGTIFGERAPIYFGYLFTNYYYDSLDIQDPKRSSVIEVLNESNLPGASKTVNVTTQQVYEGVEYFKQYRKEKDIVHSIDDKEIVTLEQAEAYYEGVIFNNMPLDTYIAEIETMLNQDVKFFNNLKFKDMFYLPMLEVINFLTLNEFTVYICSGTDRAIVRTIIKNHTDIPSDRIIGTDYIYNEDQNGKLLRGDKLIFKNVKENKIGSISREIGKNPILSFGNSSGDIAMHRYTLNNPNYHSNSYMVVADDLIREYGYSQEELQIRTKNWDIYEQFSMKNDWKTIYGENVTLAS